MGSANDETVYVESEGAFAGVGRWGAAHKTYSAAVDSALQKLAGLHGDAPWGPDDAGAAFQASYGGIDFATSPVVKDTNKRLGDVEPKVRGALNSTLATDPEMRGYMEQAQESLDKS